MAQRPTSLKAIVCAPCRAVVAKGNKVLRGQLIGEPGGFISAAIHAPTSGTVKEIATCLGPAGNQLPAVILESDGDDLAAEPMPALDWPNASPDELKKRIAEAGIVGMGGAAFPTHVKLSVPPQKKVDLLIINGAECEPFLTAPKS